MATRAQHGSLQRRKRSGVWKWMGLWRDGNTRRAKTLGLCSQMTKTAAQAELAKLVQPHNEKTGATEITLQTYARTVVFPWYRRSWKPSTALTTEHRVDHHILKELGNKPLSWFNRNNLQDFLDKKATTPRNEKGELLSASTVAHLRWDLRQLFRMAVNDQLLTSNPAELLHPPKKTPQQRRVLTINELRTLIAALPLRDRLIIELAGIAGLRPGEILGLQWTDLHNDGLHIRRTIYQRNIQTPKTHHSVRTAAISASIRDDLATWRNIAPNTDGWIFPSEKGTPLAHENYWRRNIKPILDDLHVDGVNFQALRRTAVTLLNAHGADASVVAAQCGHTVDVSTNVYNQIGISRQQDAINNLGEALAPTATKKHFRLTPSAARARRDSPFPIRGTKHT